jgi:ABC-type phosphate transport system substrate-binding protein
VTARDTRIIRRTGLTLAVVAGISLFSFAGARSTDVNVAETGSTLIYPLFKAWIDGYAKVDPSLHLTAGATGSGEGIAQTISKQVQIGTSDAYMTDNQAMANPPRDHLRFSSVVLAGPQHVRHRHLHTDDPGHRARPPCRARAQHE